MNINKFRFDQVGLNRFFGPLEAKIMDIIWTNSEMSIKEVKQQLEKEKPTNFNTVMTVMNRLVDKKILEKRVEGRMSQFKPVQSKEEFIDEQSKKLTENLLDEFGGLVVNHMLDSLQDVDQSLLERLEQKIEQLKKGKSE
ncbi:BlaI/MecI/CopY family transcriptional regulator [Metabacillus sediminilitoris]|uniref:BlaI/MecI/CopY family transcriptional regulator n=1 Tax=Metabacillus sediminilitoris TaxID=2567941 RepID=A0A4S4BV47_9BACI|nr:BlaI/MecI/CopY family transcriptional regulator [Metabacillus sediminilitoris]QGQ47731.1 BlaI/MecI/CopY family transcriptional regulator [Metabacillus sediminilitoris]THF76836.1 BlaI/MecI/CopY family transcriptional regulator [Metabacillus sediminilitoris]